MQSNDRHRVYKSLETDDELRARCCKYCWSETLKDGLLDYHVEVVHNVQRRLIERTTDKSTSAR